MNTMDNAKLYELCKNNEHYIKKDVPNWEDHKVVISDCTINHADLSKYDLSYARFVNVQLRNCTFSDTKMKQCQMTNVRIVNSRFEGADLSNAEFTDCYAPYVDFQGAKFRKAMFANTSYKPFDRERGFRGCDFSNADLSDCVINSVDFTKSKFNDAYLSGMSVIYGNFSLTDLSRASLIEADIDSTNFDGTYADRATVMKAVFNDCSIENATFTHAFMPDVTFRDTNIERTNFTGAELTRASFGDCTRILNCDFTNVDLEKADFVHKDAEGSPVALDGSVFDNSRMPGIAIAKEQLDKAKFKSAILTERSDIPITPTGTNQEETEELNDEDALERD